MRDCSCDYHADKSLWGSKMQAPKKITSGFTLIELLVVIAIIALLLSVVAPALRKAKEHAKTVLCKSNLRQMGIAMILYVNENADKVCPVTGSAEADNEYWFHKIAPYLGDNSDYLAGDELNMEVAFCPVTKQEREPSTPDESWIGTNKQSWRYRQAEGGYGMNLWLNDKGAYSQQMGEEYYFNRYTRAGSDVPVFADSVWVGGWPKGTDSCALVDLEGGGYPGFPVLEDMMGRFCIDRHGRAINVVFTGGHVEKVDLEDIWTLRWSYGYERPTTRIELPE